MLDLLIILLYVLVGIKILVAFFSWIETRFNIFGKTEESTLDASRSQENQRQAPESQTSEKPFEPVATEEKSMLKESELKIASKKSVSNDIKESLIKIVDPSDASVYKPSEEKIVGSSNNEIESLSIFSKPESSKQIQNESILPVQLKDTLSWLNQQFIPGNKIEQPQPNQEGNTVSQMQQEVEVIRREKDNAIQKMLRYVQKTNQQKQVLISSHQKALKAILNEKQNLQQKIQSIQIDHNEAIVQIKSKHDQTISQMQVQFNDRIQKMQAMLEQSQQVHQQELQYLKTSQAKNPQIDRQVESTINETINGSISSQVPSSNFFDSSAQAKIQQVRSELEFCQSQLQQAYESESKLKEEIQQVKKQFSLKAKSKAQISITDVINHPEYMRIKDKLQKYQNGTASSHIRSPMRSQITPRGDRLSKGGAQSRISERRSFVPSRITENGDNKPETSDEVFAECNFLNPESRTFLLDEIKRIKKLPIKKTKLIFKLDKLSPGNPHEFIDNIPNIVLVIELTNKKVLAAFTQTAFNKQDATHSQSVSTISRSRVGNNKSLILDLTNKVAFLNNNSNETIIYDENAIVWGKDELIIKNDEPTLIYSSFGSQEGVYGDGKYTVDDLLGGDQGFERINQYEFYRIYIG